MSIHNLARELASALTQSQEYRALLQAKAKIQGNDQATAMVRDFRMKQIEYQAAQLTGGTIAPEKTQQMESLAGILSYNPDVRSYLEAEYRFSLLFSDVHKILGEAFGGFLE